MGRRNPPRCHDSPSSRSGFFLVPSPALAAELVIASDDPPPPEEPPPEEPPAPGGLDIDAIGSVRVGLGYSYLLHSRILSISFEDQIQIHRLSRVTVMTAVFGMDGQRPFDEEPRRRGFLATTLGPGLLFAPHHAPAFTLSATAAPIWQSRDDTTHLTGFGVGLRAEAYPFYLPLLEAVECRRGAFATYVLSGLHGWALTRRDFIGVSGESYAVGFGIDLGREILLPILGATLSAACAVENGAKYHPS